MKTPNSAYKSVLVLLIVVAFTAGILAAFFAFYAFTSRENSIVGRWVEKRFYGEEVAMVDAVKKVMPAVVSIEIVSKVAGDKEDVTGGTGFVVDKSGLILTNAHVVARLAASSDYLVTFGDGTSYQAVLVGRDPFEDIAVLKLVADAGKNDFPVVDFGDSGKIELGQKVLTIGNSLLTYGHSVTSGIVSALKRDVSADYYDFKGPSENLVGLIQIDAAVNNGNSGGPLFNLRGEVIGMVTAFEQSASGIGFAIPMSAIMPDMDSIKKYGEIIRPVLGVRFVMLNEADAAKIDSKLSYGALIVRDKSGMEDAVLKKSNAYKAGLREGDVILAVNDLKIDSENPLNDVVRKYAPGDKLDVKFWRNGLEKSVSVVLNSSKDFE